MIANIAIVAAGSAAGGVLRYLVSYLCRAYPAPLPYWTLAVNVVGGLLIGLIDRLLEAGDPVGGQLGLLQRLFHFSRIRGGQVAAE